MVSTGHQGNAPKGPVQNGNTPDLATMYSMDRLSTAFENSARRWELIVYPSLFAFIILAAYGFYLIFSLAKDVHFLAISVDTNMNVLASNMQSMSDNMGQLTGHIRVMTQSVESISQKVGTLEPMLANLDSMDRSMKTLSTTTYNMQGDMSRLNTNIGRPMHFMNSFMPW